MFHALITGGAGFIGSHLAETLLAAGHPVTVVDNLSTGHFENIAHLAGAPGFRFAIEDIRNEVVMDRLLSECDVIFHLAAAVGSATVVLFGSGDRHVSAEALHQEALAAKINVSLATVYNTLNQFKAAGLLREVAFEGDRSFFDTNTSNHFHYYLEETGGLVDIGTETLEVTGLPALPDGTEIDRIDIIVRLRKTV